MLTRQGFLGVILPPEGIYCVVGVSGTKAIQQTFHADLVGVDAAVEKLDKQGVNSFVAVANYQDDQNRTAANAVQLKSFFLDLDCGADNIKKYPDQASAIQGLKKFVKDMKLPRPMVVNSGNGVHAYWPLTAPLGRTEWRVIAEKLKVACLMSGLKIDASVTADAARVLRAVGSSNWKDPANPIKVVVLNEVPAVDVSVFKTLLNVTDSGLEGYISGRPMDDATKALLNNTPASFKLILKKSLAGVGCGQLAEIINSQESVSEPLWRAALSVAQFCKDRTKAIHLISSGHAEYNARETEDKASRIQGPYKCSTFWKDNPTGCDGCIHKDKITSPIMLGKGEVEVATAEDNVVRSTTEPEKVYVIPEYPFPFVRGKYGGLYTKSSDPDTNPQDVMVYEHDFYLVNTIDDPQQGMCGLFRLHLPQDGVKEFLIPLREMIAKDAFGKRVAEQGISTTGKQMEQLMGYANISVKSYQKSQKAAKARTQFGWVDNFTGFVIGERHVTATDTHYSPPSSLTLDLVKSFHMVGTLDKWKSIASMYNRPGSEGLMFALFAGFGSPLVPFSNQRGCVISLYSAEAGTGKTTTLRMINSIFGNPDDLMLIKNDTMNGRINRIGVMNNMATCVDEITNESSETTSDFLYHYMQGRGKIRLQGSYNLERKNTTSWLSHAIVTANEAMEDKLLSKKRNPDGELVRVIEYPCAPIMGISKAESDAAFGLLSKNYGLAGEAYIRHIMANLPEVQNAISKMQLRIDEAAGLVQRERYWSTAATTSMVGGLYARSAGVLDFTDEEFKRVYSWIIALIKQKGQKSATSPAHEAGMALGSFISEFQQGMLVINQGVSRKGNMVEAPIREPRSALCIRYEPDAKLLYVSRTKFRDFCTKSHLGYSSVLKVAAAEGKYVGEKKMRMGKGFHASEPEIALIFNHDESLFGD